MSLKSFPLRLCTSALCLMVPVVHTHLYPIAGWGTSLGQRKIFCYGSLCFVADCVVRHCHLYHLYSWQDILLIFAEMELASTTMDTPGTNVMFICSTGEPVLAQVVGHSGSDSSMNSTDDDASGVGFPKICWQLPSLLPKGPNHHPKVMPKAFPWKVVSMCRSSRSSGAGPRSFTPSWSRSRSQYIGSPLNASDVEFFSFCSAISVPENVHVRW